MATIRQTSWAGVIFREPIICSNVPRHWCRAGRKPHHGSAVMPYGDQYRATDFQVPGQGQAFDQNSSGRTARTIEHEVFPHRRDRASQMAMYNLDESNQGIRPAPSLNYGLKPPNYSRLSPRPRTPSSRLMTGGFQGISSRRSTRRNSRPSFEKRKIFYENTA